uniref:Uncharacterized protein n=1 Tax=Arundo donax TaxID=35708 RepID=A0A0A8ZU79_ARUDO
MRRVHLFRVSGQWKFVARSEVRLASLFGRAMPYIPFAMAALVSCRENTVKEKWLPRALPIALPLNFFCCP